MISAVVVSANEASKLYDCLASVKDLVDEMVVIDLSSTDQTQTVAQQFRAQIYSHQPVDYVEEIRDWAIKKALGEWVLVLDPDERLPKVLVERLREVARRNHYMAVNIPRQNIFFGTWIAHSNFWPDRHIRFFKKDQVVWPKRIHAYPQVEGEVLNLPARKELAIVHIGYDRLTDFISRQLRYAQVEAKNRLEEKSYFSPWNLIWQPTREFLVRFIKYKGFLDGFYGVYLVFVLMAYRIVVEFNVLKLQLNKK